MPTTTETANVAAHLAERAAGSPHRDAVVAPARGGGWSRIDFEELAARASRVARGLEREGLRRGDRVCVFVRPGPDWVAIVYGLFQLGAVPVLIDPGMGRKGVVSCVQRTRPRGFLGIPLAHALRLTSPRAFESVEVAVTVGAPRLWSGTTFARLTAGPDEPYPCAATAPEDEAAILFTSGSTGPAKGVRYEHGMFAAQVRVLRELYGMRPGEVDLACFPLFALFSAALEWTSVLPDMDFSRPATCDPARIVRAIHEHGATNAFGSPAIWRRVAPWCAANGEGLAPLGRLLIAGAPVPPSLIQACVDLLPPGGDVHTPYGATEALPVSSQGGRELLDRYRERTETGEGNCVGRPAPSVEVRVIEIEDGPIAEMTAARELPRGEIGELCVRGPVVTREYDADPEATALAKIADGGGFWHRMGDLVRLDEDGCLWFHGRKSHRLRTAKGLLTPVPLENVFDRHPLVERSALVGVGAPGAERPYLVVEPKRGLKVRGARDRDRLTNDILRTGLWFPPCLAVEGVLFRSDLPVDVRHNAKIKRGELKRWAEAQLR